MGNRKIGRHRINLVGIGMIVALGLLLEACGGRVARPVQRSTSSDHLMTCTHIQAEITTNIERVTDLGAEKKKQSGQNVGHFLMGGLFALNLKNTEGKEIDALIARNRELRDLSSNKKCES